MKEIDYKDYKLIIEDSEIYIDNQARKRSGHMSHAMTQLKNGSFIDFNSNCSAERSLGHSTYGWIEYRFSEDNGKTFSDVYELPYAKENFIEGIRSISVENAVTCDNGDVIAFCLRNYCYDELCCCPWDTPTYIVSKDNGLTWGEPKEFIPYKGRIYDARYYKGSVYVMIFCNADFIGKTDEHVYRLYRSDDNGESFYEHSVLPINGVGRGYCTFVFDDNDCLHAYAYNGDDEFNLDHAISNDFGKTWTLCEPCKLSDGARNPQTAFVDGVFILHGRGCDGKNYPTGFVIYTSLDGQNWTEAYKLEEKPMWCYYSKNIKLTDEKGDFLLIQYSDAYSDARVNVKHVNIRIEK